MNKDFAAAKKALLKQLKDSTPATTAILIIALLLSFIISGSSNGPSVTEETSKKTGPYEVVHVIDGDTIVVDKNDQRETIRLIGIDTPEVDSPYTQTECFGPEASNYTRSLLLNEFVSLEADQSQDDRDIYDRMLRYVYLGNTNVNQLLIQEGYAFEFTFRTAYAHQDEFKKAQDQARKSGAGLWADDTCAGLPTTTAIEFDADEQYNSSDVAEGCIHFSEAPNNIGVDTCVSGLVDNVFVSSSDTTFVNFCQNYQTCPFSSVIFSDDKNKFPNVSNYNETTITITGRIDTYQGRPQIILRDTSQLRVE